MHFTPYLLFDGDCEEAFKFYEQCFGGKITAMMTHEGTPAAEHVPADWQQKIMHATLTVGDATLMGSDSPPAYFEEPKGYYVSIQIEEPNEAERIFHALEEGGSVRMPMEETFWAYRFGMVIDRFGTHWMINCQKPV